MKRHISLSGIGLGVYLIGLGVCYVFQQTLGLQIIGFGLRLYPFLIILLGLDFILTNTERTSSLFTKPSPMVVTLLILFTIVGVIGNFFFNSLLFDIPRFRYFDHWEKGWFDRDQGPQIIVNKDFKIPPGIQTIKIKNQSGDIRINSSNNGTISAEAQIRVKFRRKSFSKNDFNFIGDVRGDKFLIRLDFPWRSDRFNRYFNSDIVLNIPEGLSVSIENTAGDIEVATIAGNLDVETKSGNVQIQSADRNLRLTTLFGNVTVGNITGDAEITTKAGEINIKKVKGNARIESVSGNVTLTECEGPVHIELKSGNLDVNLAKISDDCYLDLKSGNIQLGLPSAAQFSIDAQSLSGNINSDFEVMVERKFARATARGNVNGGGPLVKVRNISGNIELRNY